MGWDTLEPDHHGRRRSCFALGILLFLVNVVRQPAARRAGRRQSLGRADARMGDASPPPPYNFAVIPMVASRHPLWEDRLGRDVAALDRCIDSGICSTRAARPSAPRALDAEPDVILKMPGDSLAAAAARRWRLPVLFVGAAAALRGGSRGAAAALAHRWSRPSGCGRSQPWARPRRPPMAEALRPRRAAAGRQRRPPRVGLVGHVAS